MKRVVPAVAALATALFANTSAAAPVAPRVQTLEYVGGGVTIGPDRVIVVRAGNNIGAVVFRGAPSGSSRSR